MIDKLQTGDVISSVSLSFPLVQHKGIILIENNNIFVCHNTHRKANQYNGNIVKDSIDDWFCLRGKILKIEKTNATKEHIEKINYELKNTKFDLINFNCEHYVSLIKNNELVSPQLRNFGLLIVLLLLVIILKK